MEPLTRTNCNGVLCAFTISLTFSHSPVSVARKNFANGFQCEALGVCVCVRLGKKLSQTSVCVNVVEWGTEERDEWNCVIWNECECLFVSRHIRVRYSNFRQSVHISKLFTCGCTNLIKSFTSALKMKWSFATQHRWILDSCKLEKIILFFVCSSLFLFHSFCSTEFDWKSSFLSLFLALSLSIRSLVECYEWDGNLVMIFLWESVVRMGILH